MAASYVPSAKAIAFQRDLAAAIEARFADPAYGISGEVVIKSFSEATGLEGAPLITVKASSAGNVDAILRIEQVGTLAKDILGLPQTVFTPHICKLIVDDNTMSVPKFTKLLLAIGGECIARGIKLEVYEVASVTEGGFDTASNLKAVYDSVQYPLLSTL
jgi:hypothetical protein